MATKLFLRGSMRNRITDTGDGCVFDMLTTPGGPAGNFNNRTVATAASGTNIQWTHTASGLTIAWISGRVPSGGFTLTTTDFSFWAIESNMAANAGGRYRVYRYQPGTPTITELGGGPFDDGIEFDATVSTEMAWTGNVTDTAFSENDRILLRVFITNIGTMAGSHTCTMRHEGADGQTGDAFFNIAETVAFKEDNQYTPPSIMQAVRRSSLW